MASRNWIETVFGARRRPASARPRRERDDWYVPLEVCRLEERRVLNVAPVLSGANNLTSIHQNQPNTSNTGTLVSSLIAGKVTDPDPGALAGIAVTAVDITNGTWQYSTDSGSNWNNFGSPTNSSARLLAADATTFVRFIPAADFSGTVSPGITFRAWDQTSGTAGNTANTSSNGGTTAFSTATAHSDIAIDQPITITGATTKSINDSQTANPFSGVTIGDSISASESITVTLTQSNTANGTISNLGGFIDNNNGTFTFTGNAAAATAALQGLLFTPTAHQVAPGSTVDTTFTILAADSVTSTTDSNSVVHVTAVNNPPTINGTVGNQAVNDNATISPFSGVTISDPDLSSEPASVTVTLDNAADGRFTAGSTAGWTVNVAAGTYSFSGTRAQVESALQGLVFAPTNHQVVPGSTVTTQFTIQLTDGANSASDNTTSVVATAINNPPTINGTVANQAVNDNATIAPFSGVTISDPDLSSEPASVTVTLDHAADGQFTAASTVGWVVNVGAGTYSFTGTRAATEAALQALVFAPTNHQVIPGSTVTTKFTIQLTDGANSANDNTTTVVATAINNPPTILGTVANQAVNDNATIAPFSGVTISDPDNSAEPASVTVTLDDPANGRFTAASTVGWTVNVGTGIYSFSGTRAQVEAAMQALVFAPTNHQVVPRSTMTTKFTIQLTDGANSASDNTTTVVATAINNPPTINGTVANQAVNDNATIAPFSGVTISDPDNSSEPASVIVTLDTPANGQFTAGSTVGWTVNVGAGTYTFSGTRAQVEAALVALVFAPTNHEGIPGSTFTTHFTIQLTDGANSASDSNTSVIATAFNNPPTINGTVANQAVNDNATIQPFSGVTISDADLSSEPASVTVTLDHPANGQFTPTSTIGWTVNVVAGTYTFSGTRAQVESGLQALVFSPTAHQVNPGATVTTTFTIQLTDGPNSATDNKTTVVATAFNNPPTIVGTVANQAVNDNATIQPFSGVTISDPDIATEPAVITVTLDHAANGQFTAGSTVGWVVNVGAGTYTFAGTRAAAQAALEALVFAPTNHQVVPGNTVTTNFTIQLTDGPNSASDANTSVIATAINNPPTIVGTTANQAVNDNATIAPFSGVTISDPDNPAEPASITITLDNAANGQFTAASTVGWTVNVGAGTYSFSGTRAQAESALQALVFVPTAHQVNPGSTVTTHFTIQLTDGANSASDANTSVVATAINNPPTILGAQANQAILDNQTLAPFSGVTISDPDISTEPATVTVTLDHAANGQFTAASTVGWTVNVGAGTYTFSGTRSQAQAALEALVFAPTAHQVVPGASVTTQFTIQLVDGANLANDANTSVIATAFNNPPTIVGTTANQAVNDNATIQPFSSVTISDPDNPAEPATITITLDHPANGQFTAASTVGWTVNVAAGTYAFSGTRAQVQAALQALVFVPTNHQVIPGATVTTNFTIQLDDGGNLASDANTSVIATAINNPPTILGTVANQAVNDNATIAPFTGVVFSDPDNSAEPTTITVTLDNAANGQFTAASTVGWTVNVAAGTYSFSGTRAAVQAALQALVFTPTIHQVAAGSTVTTTFTLLDNDGPVNMASDSKTTVVATAINDAPVLDTTKVLPLTTITEKQISNVGNTVASILGIAVTDVDFAPLQGIAITNTIVTGFGLGQWQYSIDSGATWNPIGAVSDNSALLLRATDLVRFLPDAKNGNVATITYRAWDQTGTSAGKQGQNFNASINGGTAPFSLATATGTITVQNVNDAPVLTSPNPPTFPNYPFLLPVTVSGSSGALNGTVVGALHATSVDLPVVPFAWAINSGNNGAFSINPTTGVVSVANTSQFAYTPTPVVLMIAATENQFNSTSAPATGTQSLTIVPWMVTTSATQIDNQFKTTLTINLLCADPAQQFTATIVWGGGKPNEVHTILPNLAVPMTFQQQFLTNPNPNNAAAPIPISVIVQPMGQPNAVAATASTQAKIPGAGLSVVKIAPSGGGGFVDVLLPSIPDAPVQATEAETNVAQSVEGGVASSEATNTDERVVFLRIVSAADEEGQRILVPDRELDNLPGLFKKLPDGHYKVYLSEAGHERLVIDVVVRQGRAVDPTDDSGGTLDRPPTSQSEAGHRDPVAATQGHSQRGGQGAEQNNTAQPNGDDSPNLSVPLGNPSSEILPPVTPLPLTPTSSSQTANPLRPAKHPATGQAEKSRWSAPLTAAGGAIGIGAGAILSREERVDRAMQQLEPRSLSKAARLTRWLRKSK